MKFTLEEWNLIYKAVKAKAQREKEGMNEANDSEIIKEACRKNYCTLSAIISKIENEEI